MKVVKPDFDTSKYDVPKTKKADTRSGSRGKTPIASNPPPVPQIPAPQSYIRRRASLAAQKVIKTVITDFNNTPKKRRRKESTPESDEEYEVDRIDDIRSKYGKPQYFVHWKGWSDSDNSWVNEDEMSCEDVIADFYSQHGYVYKDITRAQKKTVVRSIMARMQLSTSLATTGSRSKSAVRAPPAATVPVRHRTHVPRSSATPIRRQQPPAGSPSPSQPPAMAFRTSVGRAQAPSPVTTTRTSSPASRAMSPSTRAQPPAVRPRVRSAESSKSRSSATRAQPSVSTPFSLSKPMSQPSRASPVQPPAHSRAPPVQPPAQPRSSPTPVVQPPVQSLPSVEPPAESRPAIQPPSPVRDPSVQPLSPVGAPSVQPPALARAPIQPPAQASAPIQPPAQVHAPPTPLLPSVQPPARSRSSPPPVQPPAQACLPSIQPPVQSRPHPIPRPPLPAIQQRAKSRPLSSYVQPSQCFLPSRAPSVPSSSSSSFYSMPILSPQLPPQVPSSSQPLPSPSLLEVLLSPHLKFNQYSTFSDAARLLDFSSPSTSTSTRLPPVSQLLAPRPSFNILYSSDFTPRVVQPSLPPTPAPAASTRHTTTVTSERDELLKEIEKNPSGDHYERYRKLMIIDGCDEQARRQPATDRCQDENSPSTDASQQQQQQQPLLDTPYNSPVNIIRHLESASVLDNYQSDETQRLLTDEDPKPSIPIPLMTSTPIPRAKSIVRRLNMTEKSATMNIKQAVCFASNVDVSTIDTLEKTREPLNDLNLVNNDDITSGTISSESSFSTYIPMICDKLVKLESVSSGGSSSNSVCMPPCKHTNYQGCLIEAQAQRKRSHSTARIEGGDLSANSGPAVKRRVLTFREDAKPDGFQRQAEIKLVGACETSGTVCAMVRFDDSSDSEIFNISQLKEKGKQNIIDYIQNVMKNSKKDGVIQL